MTAPADFVRRELKIPLCAADALDLDALLLDSPWHFRRSHPARWVNSYYYDTERSGDYCDNLIGLAHRIKLRFRWYGAIAGDHPLTLERKRKTGTVSCKETVALGVRTTGLASFRAAEALAGANLHPAMAAELAMRPQRRLFVRYHRRYLADRTGMRVTIDREMRYADGRELAPLLMTSPVHTVVEIKFGSDQADSADRLLERLPFRTFRHSKYVVGVNVSGG